MPTVDRSLARPTRVHRFPSAPNGRLFIKREDELSSGISGGKLRKYASLLPAVRERGVEEVALIGGPHSNNLVGLLQLLKEWRIKPWVFVRKAGDPVLRGNALFLEMLAAPDSLIAVSRERWPQVESIAGAFLADRAAAGVSAFLIPEGAFCRESLPGAMTLAEDILRNERESGLYFERLFIDSGTGLSAIGLALGLATLDPRAEERRIHVTLIAGDPTDFQCRLQTMRGVDARSLPQVDFLEPPTAKSFGAVNATVLDACRRIARSEGLLMDPVYSVKHYMAFERWVAENEPAGDCLFIYNGGSLGLAGSF